MNYGKHQRVELTHAEYKRLIWRYSKTITDDYIELADEIGVSRNENICGAFFFIANMIEEDCLKEQINATKIIESKEIIRNINDISRGVL